MDTPEIREVFRKARVRTRVTNEQNWRGQKPKDLRHTCKAEISSDDSDEASDDDERLVRAVEMEKNEV